MQLHKFIFFLFVLLMFSIVLKSQQVTTYRVKVVGGGNTDFVIHRLSDFQNGKAYNNWTTFSIYFMDTTPGPTPAGSGWELTVEAYEANLEGVGGNTLDLAVLEVEASGPANGPNGEVITYSAIKELKQTAQTLISAPQQAVGSDAYNDNFTISYYCGQENTILGEPVWNEKGDHYTVTLIFRLNPL